MKQISYKTYINFIIIFVLGLIVGFYYKPLIIKNPNLTDSQTNFVNDKFKVCFTLPNGCEQFVIDEISTAKHNIFMQAYGFTSRSIALALIEAKTRGIKVNILLDKANLKDRHSQYPKLKEANIDIGIDKVHGIAHNKIIIIDQQKVLTGSYNFTNAANKRNAENIIVIEDKRITEQYLNNWYLRQKNAVWSN